MQQAFFLRGGVLTAAAWQNVNLRAIQQFCLYAKLTLSLRKLLVNNLSIERNYARTKFFQLLSKDDPSFRKILACQFFHAARWPLHQIRQPNSKFYDPPVVAIFHWLRNYAALEQDRPKNIVAARIIVSCSNGGLARIAPDNHELHPFTQVIRQGLHRRASMLLRISRPRGRHGARSRRQAAKTARGVRASTLLLPRKCAWRQPNPTPQFRSI